MFWRARVRACSVWWAATGNLLCVLTLTLSFVLLAGAATASAQPARGAPPVEVAAAADTAAEAGAASETEALGEAKRTGRKVEVVSLRGESSEVFATPEGAFEAREYLRPVWTRTDGTWRAVDTTLTAVGGMVAPRAASVGLGFSGGGDQPLVHLERAGRTLELRWPGEVSAPMIADDTATYADILPGVDLRLTAKADGFTQLLVVKSAEAAASSQLAELRLKLATTGMAVRETAEGGLEAVDHGAGGVVFEAPTPVMWDSSSGVAAPSARVAEQEVSGEPEEPGAGESGHLAPVGVEVSDGGQELVLTPDRQVLAGEDTVYPVFIDPQWDTPRSSAWTMTSKYWASSPQWKFNGDSDAGLGYCGWEYCKPYDTKRLFYQIPTSKFAGKSILSAEFVVHETHAASCLAREVQLWRTKGINSSTTWNTQNAEGFWVDHIEDRSFAYGADGCASADAEFNVKSVVAQAAAQKWPSVTFGIRATSESDPYTWKRFSDTAFLRVYYNRPPTQIKTSQLTQNPGGTCGKPGAAKLVRTLPSLLANNVTDPDGDRVRVQFEASWDAGDGKGFASHWTSAISGFKESGSQFPISLPSSIPKNKTIGWSARSNDGAQWSPWSWVGSATACNMVYDTSVPAGPSITSSQYPSSDPADPLDPWLDGVGRYGTFTIDSTSTDVSKYWFGINQDPSSAHTLTTSGGGAQTVKFMPTKPGVNRVTAQAFDAAGNGSEIRTYEFKVRAGQPDRLSWNLDESEGSTAVRGQGGDWAAQLSGGAQAGVTGVTGNGLHLDGVDDQASTLSPVLNTGKSFSVSLWAKLPADKPDAATVAVSQAGHNTSGFEIYHSSALGGWVFLRHTTDAAGATSVRAVQPACPAGDTQCADSRLASWTQLVGVFDNGAHQMKLYINGSLVASTTFTAPWDARGRTILGAASHFGTTENFFAGDLDEVQLFDYQLTDDLVAQLYAKQPVTTNRPAKLVWPLDEDSDATAMVGHAQVVDAAVKGGAKTGGSGVAGNGMELDGIDDYATTGRPIMDTYQSFAVSAWARLPKDKSSSQAMVVAHQSGTANRGFELYHSNGWVFQRATADVVGAPLVRAVETATSGPNCPVAPPGEWTHAVGVYDIDAQQIRLYVNGCLKDTQPFTTPWLATGSVTLGASGYPSGFANFFQGDLDDIRLYDRTISDDEVQQLFKQRPLVKSRWLLDSSSGSAPGPISSPNAGSSAYPLTLSGNAAIGSGWVDNGALVLDGVDDYAATTGVPLDTSTSYTVTAWAQAAAVPTGAATVISAAGTTRSAFAIGYVPDAQGIGHWRIQLPDADKADADTVTVENQSFYSAADWNHLALVYDGFADQARLYVNGQLEQVVCPDSDEDGTSDDASCTDRVSWASNTEAFGATKSLQVGRVMNGSTASEYWPGGIDDVWAFQGALDDTQISMLAQGWGGLPTQVPAEG